MRAGYRAAGVIACTALIAACIAQPRPQPARPAAAPPAAGAAGGAQALPASATAPVAIDAAVDASLVRDGYHVVRRGGEVRYCRSETPTGTAFATTVCLSPAQVQQRQRNLKQSQDDLSLTRGITCAGKLCVGGGG